MPYKKGDVLALLGEGGRMYDVATVTQVRRDGGVYSDGRRLGRLNSPHLRLATDDDRDELARRAEAAERRTVTDAEKARAFDEIVRRAVGVSIDFTDGAALFHLQSATITWADGSYSHAVRIGSEPLDTVLVRAALEIPKKMAKKGGAL